MKSFGKAIPPRRSRRNRLIADAHGPQSPPDNATVDAVAITDQIAWRFVPGKCFDNLLRNPFRCRMGRHIDPHKVSPCQSDNDQGVEQLKSDSRHNEQVHRCNLRRVIADKGTPALTGRTTLPGHVLRYGRLRDRKPKLEQLAMNPRCTPKRVLQAHSSDQFPQFRADRRPPARGARLPAPIAAKPGTVPPHQRLRPDNQHCRED